MRRTAYGSDFLKSKVCNGKLVPVRQLNENSLLRLDAELHQANSQLICLLSDFGEGQAAHSVYHSLMLWVDIRSFVQHVAESKPAHQRRLT